MSLFNNIGGEAAVDAAVDLFYKKVLADDRINEFFDTVDMDKQRAKQKAFLTLAFGGPSNYSGKNLRAGHKHLHLTEHHFNAVAEDLVATLEELKVPKEYIDEVVEILGGTMDDVLNR